ncbi:hypothetical protein FNAPI_10564 [Fusarium napiforme]|uniref:Uncharacterized protein n=1 Tax=Fusarium napiforme TaxID=42672 RepID=A0A8H5IQK4_9HYPO|nr:hypothetical protein FNAPI_10564 [Fusarium napiforme]
MAGIDTGDSLSSQAESLSLSQLLPSLELHRPSQVPDPAAEFNAAYQTSTQSTIGNLIMEAYFENPPSGEGTRGESSSVGHEMRRSIKVDAENDKATRKDLVTGRD